VTDDERYEKGLEIRHAMFGAEATDRAIAEADDFMRPLQDLVTRACFGEVWTRDELPRSVRSMLTIAMLVALGRTEELKVHVHGALANGVTREQIREVLLHGAIYCGVPASVASFRAAAQALVEHEANV
jgi:4-carboxymuconolactone decarboxylase